LRGLTLPSRAPLAIPTKPTEYPVGSFVRTSKGDFYIITSSKRYRIISKRILDSWSPPRLIETSETALKNYRITSKLKFRNGSLLHNLSDGKIYLIEEGKRRHIISPDAFERIGGRYKDAVTVSLTEINLHEEGEPLE
jgi:hypothetical protein